VPDELSEETPDADLPPGSALDQLFDAIQEAGEVALGERYTSLFVAAFRGREYTDYVDFLRDPENRRAMEESIVSSLGLDPDLAEAYRSTVREQLEALSSGLFGDLPDPRQVNVGQGADPVVLFNGEFVHEAEDLRVDGAGIDFVFRRTYRSQAIY
jgi:Domain of unknown function (DUF6531)